MYSGTVDLIDLQAQTSSRAVGLQNQAFATPRTSGAQSCGTTVPGAYP